MSSHLKLPSLRSGQPHQKRRSPSLSPLLRSTLALALSRTLLTSPAHPQVPPHLRKLPRRIASLSQQLLCRCPVISGGSTACQRRTSRTWLTSARMLMKNQSSTIDFVNLMICVCVCVFPCKYVNSLSNLSYKTNSLYFLIHYYLNNF